MSQGRLNRQGIGRAEVEDDIFEKVYDSIKKFDSVISDAQDDYVELIKIINNSKIKVEPFGADYENEIRKKFGVGVVSSKSGLPIDSFYQELRENFGHILPDVDNAEDQVHSLLEVLEYGRNTLKNNTLSDDEIEAYFGGKDGIRNAISEILGQLSVANQEIGNTKIELPKMDSASIEDIEGFISTVESKLEGLSDSDKKIPLNLDEADVIKTVETIDSTTGEVIKKVTSLNEGIGKTRQVFETVNEATGVLEQSIEKVTDTQAKAIEKVKGEQAAASSKQYWKDEEERIKSFSNALKASMEEQARFEKKFGQQIVGGVSFGDTESEIRKAVQAMDGFEEANTRALKTVQDGNTVLQQYAVSINSTDGNFKNYVLSIDEATNKHYLLEKGISSVDTAAARLGEQTKFITKFGKELEGIKLPTDVGESDLSDAIRKIEGFENSYVKAIGSAKHGNHELQQVFVVTENAAGGFDTFKVSVDQANGSTYLLEKGLRSNNIAMDNTISAINGIASAFAALGVGKGLDEIKDGLWECFDASVNFETALANVRKTTNFTISEMAGLKNEISYLSLSIPLAVDEISRIAEIGGQLNIPKENIIDFTKIMADLSATTTMSSTEAADFVARFSNITQMPMDNWNRFSSSLVQLGNNFAGTESEIAAMALRLASAAQQMGMSEADTLGLAAGLNAVGLRAEMAGTAFSKAMNRINIAVNTGNDELADFARVAGMSVEQFVQAFNNNASKALTSFVTGLADVERHGKNTIVLMDELGLTEVRMSDALRRAAGSGDLFKNAIEMSNQAFSENVALSNEASIRYATTESKIKLLSNATDQLKIAIGDGLSPAINTAVGGLTDFTTGAAKFLENNKWLVQAFTVLTGSVAGTV